MADIMNANNYKYVWKDSKIWFTNFSRVKHNCVKYNYTYVYEYTEERKTLRYTFDYKIFLSELEGNSALNYIKYIA